MAAQEVLAFRATDGSNQTLRNHDTPSSTRSTPRYKADNKWNQVVDPTKWQPLCVLPH